MTTKYEKGYENFGFASPGWGVPHKAHELYRSGNDTTREALKLKPPKYTENFFQWNGTWETSRQTAFQEGGPIRYLGTKDMTGMPVFDSVTLPEFAEVAPKLLSKWRQSQFNLGVFVGEGKESVELIVSRLTDLAKAANQLRQRNLGGALRTLAHVPKGSRRSAQSILGNTANSLSDAWLELQYGWKPLINDISAAAEMVKLHPKEERVKARSTNRGGAHLNSSSNIGTVKVFNNDKRLQEIVVVASQPSMMERLGLSDAASIAWELVPFSFVLDWFGPISDYLASIHAINNMPVMSCIQTFSSKQVANITVNPNVDKFYGYPVLMRGTTTSIIISGTRTVYSSLPEAWLASNQVPREISNNYEPSLQRMANATALVQQKLRSLLR